MARNANETPAEKQALAIYRDLQKGHIDRSLLAPNLNDYFDAQAVADFRDSLGPLGEPLTFRQNARRTSRRHDLPRLPDRLSPAAA